MTKFPTGKTVTGLNVSSVNLVFALFGGKFLSKLFNYFFKDVLYISLETQCIINFSGLQWLPEGTEKRKVNVNEETVVSI